MSIAFAMKLPANAVAMVFVPQPDGSTQAVTLTQDEAKQLLAVLTEALSEAAAIPVLTAPAADPAPAVEEAPAPAASADEPLAVGQAITAGPTACASQPI